ncbi:hypothetical protein IX321_002338 [Bacteroides pyogenes]|nr:hypothetical protein [Bacteroides pyogenes]MBR8718364.1 hypothetical protein [Bacteroides pyogenes]MBR8747861.1 hypothetical protein [Bacteroides pyogenes]MBR8758167.1 hypothetical protein [Bacteroides pyogenes]MBR8781383.1 hypothetical protein [Bacteroides pyogenes]
MHLNIQKPGIQYLYQSEKGFKKYWLRLRIVVRELREKILIKYLIDSIRQIHMLHIRVQVSD